MGFLEFGIFTIVVIIIAALITWGLSAVPGCPAIVPKIIWGVAVLIILVMLASATGIMRHDPQIPRL